MWTTFLEGLASPGGNILVLLVLVLVIFFLKPHNADSYVQIVLGALVAMLTGKAINKPTDKP